MNSTPDAWKSPARRNAILAMKFVMHFAWVVFALATLGEMGVIDPWATVSVLITGFFVALVAAVAGGWYTARSAYFGWNAKRIVGSLLRAHKRAAPASSVPPAREPT